MNCVRICDTFETLDTLTVSEKLVENAERFFTICEMCAGANFLKVPLFFKRENGKFVCDQPIWFTPEKPTSIAEWVLFYIERAIWIQFKAHVEQSQPEIIR